MCPQIHLWTQKFNQSLPLRNAATIGGTRPNSSALVARSLAVGASVSRVAREFNVNANQVFAWRKQYGDVLRDAAEGAWQLLPITVTESATVTSTSASAAYAAPASGVLLLTVGSAQLRMEGSVDPAMLGQVLARLLP